MMRLPERITLRDARATLAKLVAELAAQPGDSPVVRIDASALVRFDSSALGVLIELHRRAVAVGRSCRLVGMPARLTELARLYGVGELVTLGSQGDAQGAV